MTPEEWSQGIQHVFGAIGCFSYTITVKRLEPAWTEADEIYAKVENQKRDAVKWLLTHDLYGR